MEMIVQAIITSPKWIGKHWKSISGFVITVWTTIVFLSGWFTGVNATVERFPKVEDRLATVEKAQVQYRSDFSMFFEMYKLDVLGRKKEAQEMARRSPSTNP